MIYLIDGYNLLFRIAKESSTLEKSRTKLLQALDAEIAKTTLHICIIFDSSEKKTAGISQRTLEATEVIFTSYGLSADEYILEKIAASKQPKQHTVVSEDRALLRHAGALGASILTTREFFSLLRKKQKKRSRTSRLPKETDANFSRLLKIFEARLKEADED